MTGRRIYGEKQTKKYKRTASFQLAVLVFIQSGFHKEEFIFFVFGAFAHLPYPDTVFIRKCSVFARLFSSLSAAQVARLKNSLCFLTLCRERRFGVPSVPQARNNKLNTAVSKPLREGTEKDENGDYFGRRQYQDTARPKERREKTIINIPYAKSYGIKKRSSSY